MAFMRSRKERKTALDRINAGTTFQAILLDGDFSSFNLTFDQANDRMATTATNDLVNGLRLKLSNVGGALPPEFNSGSVYYVINKGVPGANNFQLAATKGGAAITFTNNGSGTHTLTEQAFTDEDAVDVLVRHEADYDSSGRQAFVAGAAIEGSPTTAIPTVNITFTPTTAISYRYFAVLRDGSAITGNTTGEVAGFEDFGTSQTINSSGKTFNYDASMN